MMITVCFSLHKESLTDGKNFPLTVNFGSVLGGGPETRLHAYYEEWT